MTLNQSSDNIIQTEEGAAEAALKKESLQPNKNKEERKSREVIHPLNCKVAQLSRAKDELLQMTSSPEKGRQHGVGPSPDFFPVESSGHDTLAEPELEYRISSLLDLLRQLHGFEECGVFLLKNNGAGLDKLVLSTRSGGLGDLQEFEDEVHLHWKKGDIARAVSQKKRMVFPAKDEGSFLVIPFEVLEERNGFCVAHFRGCVLPEKKSSEELLSWTELISSCVENYYLKLWLESPQRDSLEDVHTEKLFTAVQLSKAMVHELNNSLQTILGRAQLLKMSQKKTWKADSNVRNLETIEETANRISPILKDFSDYLHRQFDLTGDSGEVNLQHILKGNLVLIEYILRCRGIKLELDFDKDLPAVQGNPGELEQAFLTLVWEIKELLSSGGDIRLETGTEQELLCLDMYCSGREGLGDEWPDPAHLLARNRFKVVSQIVGRHHGELKLENLEGQKMRFSLRLPIAKVENSDWQCPGVPKE